MIPLIGYTVFVSKPDAPEREGRLIQWVGASAHVVFGDGSVTLAEIGTYRFRPDPDGFRTTALLDCAKRGSR